VSNAQLLTLPATISTSANGVVTTQLSFLPPASSSATDVAASSDSRPATAQPPEPAPTTTKSNVSVMKCPPSFYCRHCQPNPPSSFRDGPKGQARNPYLPAVVMDSGLATSWRPGMTAVVTTT